MLPSIISPANVIMFFVGLYVLYVFWKPYLTASKPMEAIVDGYEHPKGATDQTEANSYFVRFMYRPQKAGKRYYCLSKNSFDFKEDAKAAYPKGQTFMIRTYEDDQKQSRCLITTDTADRNRNILYSLAVVIGVTALIVGYQILAAGV